MKPKSAPLATIDHYIAAFPPKVRAILKKVRATIQRAVPQATEKISYRMPAFFLHGQLIFFAAFKHHLGLYPPVRDKQLLREIAPYAGPKGNLKFPLDRPIPYSLIRKIALARAKENQQKQAAKKAKQKRA